MLTELSIFNLATFEKVEISFGKSVNILSGMSGAGKSVLLKALALSMGARFSQKMIRNNADQAEVIASYDIDEKLKGKLKEHNIETTENQIIIRRVCKRGGRTSNYLNDRLITGDALVSIAGDLASVMSQDEAMGLKDTLYQLEAVDLYANHADLLKSFGVAHEQWREVSAQLKKLESEKASFAQQKQFLEFQFEELKKLDLRAGEFDELEEESKYLSHSVEIKESSRRSIECTNQFSNELNSALETLENFGGESGTLAELAKEGRSLQMSAEAWGSALQSESYGLEANPYRLQEVDSRLKDLRIAFKKFGQDELPLLKHFEELKEQLDIENGVASLDKLEKKSKVLYKECLEIAKKLHKNRETKAKQLSQEINAMLETLEMAGERFSISLKYDKENMTHTGATTISFMLKATESSPAVELHEAASGGERSRTLLAICSAMSEMMKGKLLIFDEIDTNIGSRLGKPVANAFTLLAKKNQLICVTHLAPVAASGEKHFLIEKDNIASSVIELNGQMRLEEIAQMIAGEKNSVEALNQAKNMLKQTKDS